MTPFEIFLHEEGLRDEPDHVKRLLKLTWEDGYRRGWDRCYEELNNCMGEPA